MTIAGLVPGIVPTTLRRPPGTASNLPPGRSGRRKSPARRRLSEPAGRCPKFSTCLRRSENARSSSKRSTLARGVLAAPAPPHAASGDTTAASARASASRLVVGGHRLQQVREALLGLRLARRDVLGGDAVRRGLVAAQDLARHRLAVDLVGPVVEAGPAGEAVHGLEGHVGAVTQ